MHELIALFSESAIQFPLPAHRLPHQHPVLASNWVSKWGRRLPLSFSLLPCKRRSSVTYYIHTAHGWFARRAGIIKVSLTGSVGGE